MVGSGGVEGNVRGIVGCVGGRMVCGESVGCRTEVWVCFVRRVGSM